MQPSSPLSTTTTSPPTSQSLVTEKQLYIKAPKMVAYQQREKSENDLLCFEQLPRNYRWPYKEWACHLVPLLIIKPVVDKDKAENYSEL